MFIKNNIVFSAIKENPIIFLMKNYYDKKVIVFFYHDMFSYFKKLIHNKKSNFTF